MASKMDARLLKSTKFPPEFNQKVDMEKVNLHVMKKWITKRISEILGNEDDVVIELCFNLIEASRYPDIKSLQIQLTGFLDKDTATFCKELWNLLLSGQSSSQGLDADRVANTRLSRDVQGPDDRERRDSKPVTDSWHAQERRADRAFSNRSRGSHHGRGGPRSPSPGPRGRGPRQSYGRDSYVPSPRGRRAPAARREQDRSPLSAGSSRSRSRSRSESHGSRRSHSPPRRRPSPARQEPTRKRSRSPRHARRGKNSRDRHQSRGRSRSSSSERMSPAAKRKRRPRSRSVSAGRFFRRRYSSSPRSRNRRDHRSRDRSREPDRYYRRRESPTDRQRGRRSLSPEHDYDHGRHRGRGNGRRGMPRQIRKGGHDSSRRRRNSSSDSSLSPIRGKSADVLEDDLRASSHNPTAPNENTFPESSPQEDSVLREKLLREKILKMRPSNQSGASADGTG
ncbi:hypothetical protein L249_3424 [Ophiocordyceps polyrhachis-furcata BCC 54312]|uniref:PWI domain-containing protein n=1 Tax=Ophiocordyceps polyrhachis-furcata BCC 54312 TaxID=1330021 RepID=A0A367LMG1_9HYPO|nr:hypothetical protein L249_3424 [Ophiocordyceps polyrhachis-furcata BCC 54312]